MAADGHVPLNGLTGAIGVELETAADAEERALRVEVVELLHDRPPGVPGAAVERQRNAVPGSRAGAGRPERHRRLVADGADRAPAVRRRDRRHLDGVDARIGVCAARAAAVPDRRRGPAGRRGRALGDNGLIQADDAPRPRRRRRPHEGDGKARGAAVHDERGGRARREVQRGGQEGASGRPPPTASRSRRPKAGRQASRSCRRPRLRAPGQSVSSAAPDHARPRGPGGRVAGRAAVSFGQVGTSRLIDTGTSIERSPDLRVPALGVRSRLCASETSAGFGKMRPRRRLLPQVRRCRRRYSLTLGP